MNQMTALTRITNLSPEARAALRLLVERLADNAALAHHKAAEAGKARTGEIRNQDPAA